MKEVKIVNYLILDGRIEEISLLEKEQRVRIIKELTHHIGNYAEVKRNS